MGCVEVCVTFSILFSPWTLTVGACAILIEESYAYAVVQLTQTASSSKTGPSSYLALFCVMQVKAAWPFPS